MSRVTLIADCDFSLKVEGASGTGEISYAKGDVVHLEQDPKENIFISYHEVDKVENEDGDLIESVVAFEIDITSKDVLNSILEKVLVEEEELDENIDHEEVTLDEMIIDEGMGIEEVVNYLTEAAFMNRKLVRKSRTRVIRGGKVATLLPVNRRTKKLTAKGKAAAKKKIRDIARNPKAKRLRALSVKKRGRLNLKRQVSSVGFLIRKDRMFNESLHDIASRTKYMLEAALDDESIRIRFMEDGTLKIKVEDEKLRNFKEALDACEVNYEMTQLSDMEDVHVISFHKPVAEEIISPFFSPDDLEERSKNKKKMDGEDEDDDDLDDGNGEKKDK